jgi:hypothetical protein
VNTKQPLQTKTRVDFIQYVIHRKSGIGSNLQGENEMSRCIPQNLILVVGFPGSRDSATASRILRKMFPPPLDLCLNGGRVRSVGSLGYVSRLAGSSLGGRSVDNKFHGVDNCIMRVVL